MRPGRSTWALLLAGCAAVALVAAGEIADEDPLAARSLAVAGLLLSIAFAAAAVAGALLLRAPVRRTLGLHRPRAGSPGVPLILAGLLGSSLLASAMLSATGQLEGSQLEQLDRTLGSAQAALLPALALGIALAPGVAEELLFRGFVLGALLERTRTRTAVALSTLLFALAHVEPVHMVGAGTLGLYLAAVRVTTGSTPLCMAAHVINNAFAIFLASQHWPAWSDWLTLPFAAAAAIGGLSAMLRYHLASVATPDGEG